MDDRRISSRQRVDERASIAVDEHTSIPCLIFDLSREGLRVVAPEVQAVPRVFLLSAHRFSEAQVCQVVWRKGEEIGARFRTPLG
ncbi:PilZ domain-containing protein [uncultured Methylobacterium sp.]|uniref:PilZ domain-containing protein n=1 Tax=uncultured Methylobacterium sp. TaxID=157278 RepID=UPI0035CAF074